MYYPSMKPLTNQIMINTLVGLSVQNIHSCQASSNSNPAKLKLESGPSWDSIWMAEPDAHGTDDMKGAWVELSPTPTPQKTKKKKHSNWLTDCQM